MSVTRITVRCGPAPKPRPKAGDKKIINGVEHVRVFRRVPENMPHAGAYVCSNGRPCFDWVPVAAKEKGE